jgi:RNA polymerase sigma-70 factor (ECF subfamily)
MMAEIISPSLTHEQYRRVLLLRAKKQWDGQLQPDFDPSDLVQQVLADAHKKQNQFRGQTEAELECWLCKILDRKLANAKRWIHQDKRNVNRKRSLEDLLEESSSRFRPQLAAEQSSPSKQAAKNEQLARLQDSLAKLPDDQREAVTLKHLRGLTLAEVAQQMNRSEASVAGLLRRGLDALNKLFDAQE